jgi:uncharacterized protein YyaL (SSP411 family)
MGNPESAHGNRTPNRLAEETSPYLLQHQFNPVDWYPWGEEAFSRAKEEDKPVLVSIGYSTCHWCHVMERESFENEATAAILNEHFVCIKVDREERPDVDQIYMTALQAMGQGGGWPLNMFLTPDRKPFFGGTYFPPDQRYGRRSFPAILTDIARVWREKRDEIETSSEQLTAALRNSVAERRTGDIPDAPIHQKAAHQFEQRFDALWGGFASAPKFPRSMSLQFLFRHAAIAGHDKSAEMAAFTLEKMWQGGIYDHLGGGFSRYSVDEKWLIPHFEKMLYDNALLAMAYLEGYQQTGDERFADVVRDIFRYVLRDMTHPDGGFYSAEDADSEGEEGKFYVWTPAELIEVLGEDDGALAARYYGVTATGNFEHGTSALWRNQAAEDVAEDSDLTLAALNERISEIREKLFTHRESRIRPHLDDKILTAWNALMISAMARASRVLDAPEYMEAASRAATFLHESLRDADGRLLVSFRDGTAKNTGFLDDYAFYVQALIDLYLADADPTWLARAREMQEHLDRWYGADDVGGYFFAASDRQSDLLYRARDPYDSALPAGNSVAALNLMRLSLLTGKQEYRETAESIFREFAGQIDGFPFGYPQMLMGLQILQSGGTEVVLMVPDGGDPVPFLSALDREYRPDLVVLVQGGGRDLVGLSDLVEGRSPQDGKVTAYVCRDFACQQPTTDIATMLKQLRE